ncbi:dienelactone hydrolase family protein [Sphingobium bisphenolivorans]|uniref:dienelactone hydrolase family protein n=1 Tax=Sphingobium bisphenolivorans TaxID=1335760 RepID=UPI00039CBC91|nr:dienelactone hydrolase family protein [Sphingobium bisphenolivorans]
MSPASDKRDPGEPFPYYDGDIALQGELFPPAAPANGRAALVVHEADGIGGNVRRHCHDLASRGYFAMAADMHGGGQPLKGEAMANALQRFREEPDLVRGRVDAGVEALQRISGVDLSDSAAIGFCFGGFAALELARSGAPIAAVASFHGLLSTARKAKIGQVKARVAVYTGARDPLVPAQDLGTFQQEMDAADADWQLAIYGNALHSFTNKDVDALGDPRMAYDERAHHSSWSAMLGFFDQSLGLATPR